MISRRIFILLLLVAVAINLTPTTIVNSATYTMPYAWAKSYDNTINSGYEYEEGRRILTDGKYVYVLGTLYPRLALFFAKLDTSGNMLWYKVANLGEYADLAVNGSYIYVVSGGYFLSKLDTNGNLYWVKSVNEFPVYDLFAVAVSGSYIYVGGSFMRSTVIIDNIEISIRDGIDNCVVIDFGQYLFRCLLRIRSEHFVVDRSNTLYIDRVHG